MCVCVERGGDSVYEEGRGKTVYRGVRGVEMRVRGGTRWVPLRRKGGGWDMGGKIACGKGGEEYGER